jgi:predicted membrane protein
VIKAISTRAKSFGSVLLLGLYFLIGIAVTGLILFLISLGAEFFYAKDWWILGAILRIAEWIIGIPATIMALIFIAMWIYYLFKAIFRGHIEDGKREQKIQQEQAEKEYLEEEHNKYLDEQARIHDRWKKALIQQGMSPEEADEKIKQEMQSLQIKNNQPGS